MTRKGLWYEVRGTHTMARGTRCEGVGYKIEVRGSRRNAVGSIVEVRVVETGVWRYAA